MIYLFIILFLLLVATSIGYLIECRKVKKIEQRIKEIDREQQEVTMATEKLILESFERILKGKL